jgi:CelD/BcsL family acetyltransferase involved in cellulose biosynthesis
VSRGATQPPKPADAPKGLTVVPVHDVADLQAHVPAWELLAKSAIEPNVFHEPWMLLPAVGNIAAGPRLLFLLIYGPDPTRPQGPPLLCGFFPLERRKRYKGLPLTHLRLWQHLHCVLSTPLIRRDFGPQTLDALFTWLRDDPHGARLLELNFVSADGPFHHLLVDHLNEHTRPTFVEESTTRALLVAGDDSEAYLESTLSGGNRKELRRQRRRLGEMGTLESRVLQPDGDANWWIECFLELEAKGWKGHEGTALAAREGERSFFRTVAREAFDRGRLMMLGLFLDGKPVALKCNFLMGEGALAFKIAFDEAYSRFSPGVQLELDNVLQVHTWPGLRWMDSCAISRHFMINRLWKDRRVMQSVLVSTGRRGSDLAVAALPALRWLQRLLRRPRKTGDKP